MSGYAFSVNYCKKRYSYGCWSHELQHGDKDQNMSTERLVALVTGASYGLGRNFAEELAARGYNLVLVDLPTAPLEQVAEAIITKHGVEVTTHGADLSDQSAVENIIQKIQALPRLDLLVNNAGYMIVGAIDELELDRMLKMIQLHAATILQFSRTAVQKMRPVNRGGIINVASIAGFSVARDYAVYNGTKAFIQMFTRCLALELDNTGISVLAVCPGPMRTNIFKPDDAPKLEDSFSPNAIIWTPPQKVAQGALERLGKKVVWVPGILNKVIVATSGFNAKMVDRFT